MAEGLVLGYDDSGGSQAALETAIDLALKLGEPLVVVYAYDPPARMSGEEFSEHRRALEETGEQLTKRAVTQAREAGVDAQGVLVPARPVDALLGVAESRDARLIVVGSYGEPPLRSAILGSTPHKLLHLSSRPVLVVSEQTAP
jgi:nucleotide-binding universal stress UspA family protein